MSNEGVSFRSFRDLVAWQKAMDLVEAIYKLSALLPVDERFGLVSQMRRSSISVASNLAEGHARETSREFLRYIAIARGSLAELETQIELATRLNLVDPALATGSASQCDELGRILRGLRRSIDAKLTEAIHR